FSNILPLRTRTTPPLPYTTLFRSGRCHDQPRVHGSGRREVDRQRRPHSAGLSFPREEQPSCPGRGLVTQQKPTEVTGRSIQPRLDRKSTRLNSSHGSISYAVFCLK